MTTLIPLNKLSPSPRNVRRSSDPEAGQQLKADIEARGLLQNLVVSPLRKPRGCFAVEAGNRRLAALQSLAAEGKLAPDSGIACLVLEADPAMLREASLAENLQRLSMNPADECLAFQQLLEQGADVAGIARRFGLTSRFVEGRLRLANLAPVVFDALGAGTISLDIAKAYAVTSDRDRQAQVFEQFQGSYCGNHPDSIRRLVTRATVRASDRRALLVGEEAYVAAGGRVERDLFASNDEVLWLDVPLLEQMATERMAAAADAIRAEMGLAFVRPTLESWIGAAQTDGLERLALVPPVISPEAEEQLSSLEAEYDQLYGIIEDEDAPEGERLRAEQRATDLEEQIRALRYPAPVLPEELRAEAGAFLLLSDNGEPRLDRTFYRLAPSGVSKGGEPGTSAGRGSKPAPGAAVPSHSRRLLDELAVERRDVLALHVAADPSFAAELSVFLLAHREEAHSNASAGSTMSARRPVDPVPATDMPAGSARQSLEELAATLDRSWLAFDSIGQRFEAFRALTDEQRAAWLAVLVARTLEASVAGSYPSFHDHLGHLLAIDVAAWWRPSAASYFDRVPKGLALAALEDVGGAEFRSRYTGLRKAELAQSCERIFTGDFIGEAEIKAAARAWLPEPMRFRAPAPEANNDDPAEGSAPAAGGGDDESGQEAEQEAPQLIEKVPEPVHDPEEANAPIESVLAEGSFSDADLERQAA